MTQPWQQWPSISLPARPKAVVVGGGIAGASAAHALALNGLNVTLLEKEQTLAPGASGNLAGALLPALSLQANPSSRFLEAAYRCSLEKIRLMISEGLTFDWQQTGVIHLPAKPRLQKLYDRLPELGLPQDLAQRVTAVQASGISGLNLSTPALFYPQGGHLSPPRFTRALADASPIEVTLYRCVTGLVREKDQWNVLDQTGSILARGHVVVLANGHDIIRLEQGAWMPLAKARGQVAYVPVEGIKAQPRSVVCHDGYMIPNLAGVHLLGATLQYDNFSNELNGNDHRALLRDAAERLPGFAIERPLPLAGRVSFRTNTPDHLPLVGPLPHLAEFQETYTDLHHGRRKNYPSAPCLPGLYCSIGHGSRGMITAWPAARILAAGITGNAFPFDEHLVHTVNPARFLIRALKRSPEGSITALKHPKVRTE